MTTEQVTTTTTKRTIPCSTWENVNRKLPPVVTATLYEGVMDLDLDLDSLQQRAADILIKNPWLNSTIVKSGRALTISYEQNLTQDQAFELAKKVVRRVDTDVKPSIDMDYADFVDVFRPLVHKDTVLVVGNDTVLLWDVILVPAANGGFFLAHSLNHTLGDGNTFYKIYSMLDPSRPVEALDPTRLGDFEEKKLELVPDGNSLRSGSAISNLIGRLLGSAMGLYQSPTKTSLWRIDEAKIKELKASHTRTEEVPYISSNDILTSWFLKEADLGAMIVDLRSRLELGKGCAGNYEGELPFAKGDTATPAQVRSSLNKFKRSSDSTLPGFWQLNKRGAKVGIISNWATFYETVQLNGKDPKLHLPVLLQHNGKVAEAGWEVLIVFRPLATQLAVLAIAPPDNVESGPFSECMMQAN